MAAKVCTHCGHVYLKPCDGSNPECENKKWIDAKTPAPEPEAEGESTEQPACT